MKSTRLDYSSGSESRLSIHDLDDNKYTFISRKQDAKYHISVIDFLQNWNLNKKSERIVKTKILGKSSKGLSAVPPREYFVRFNNFMKNVVFSHAITE
mmetsp:Transcript_88821/g.122640  ORF Transcript_88821/g.122640 Transcript_88821/m.122640 type:complete len:98 (-) Transcript_88821:62-355(-)